VIDVVTGLLVLNGRDHGQPGMPVAVAAIGERYGESNKCSACIACSLNYSKMPLPRCSNIIFDLMPGSLGHGCD
jgi:hypothetical protein